MAEEIVFYHNPRSRAQMVHWRLEEAGVPYRIVPVDSEKGEQAGVERKATVGWGSYDDAMATLKTALVPGLKGETAFDDHVARLSARPAAQRASGG